MAEGEEYQANAIAETLFNDFRRESSSSPVLIIFRTNGSRFSSGMVVLLH
jgi:hypothetical protein